MDYKKVGERLRSLREKSALSQQELGVMLHKSQATIAKYESGIVEIDFETLSNYIRLFQVSTDWIYFGTNYREAAILKRPAPVVKLVSEDYEVLSWLDSGISGKLGRDKGK